MECSKVNHFKTSHRPDQGLDTLGHIANQLRQYICDVLLEREMIQELLPYFADMSGSITVTYNHYIKWVDKLRTYEFADELVLAVTARKLLMLISVIPKDASWLVRTHPDVSLHGTLGIDEADPLYLGRSPDIKSKVNVEISLCVMQIYC